MSLIQTFFANSNLRIRLAQITTAAIPRSTPSSGAVSGSLAASGLHEIAVRRVGERVGEVVVHFPREDYTVVRAG